jgi:hypothetical protein
MSYTYVTQDDGTTDSITVPSTVTINTTGSYCYGTTVGGIISSTSASSMPTYTVSGSNGTSATSINWNNNNWATGISSATVKITGHGLELDETADIKIGNRSITEFMTKMEERLAILVPDPAKMKKFEALKKAYDHYKLMEKLCQDDTNQDE